MSSTTIYHKCYTYFIGWSFHNLYYYGCRYSKNCNPEDLWVTYFTSSKHVARLRRNLGEPDIIQIRKTFDNPKDCLSWENRVLKRIIKDYRIINKSKGFGKNQHHGIGSKNGMFGTTRPDCSERMKQNNPMKNDVVKKRASETKKRLNKPAWNKGLENKIQREIFLQNNPMKNSETSRKAHQNRKPEDYFKGFVWVANLETKKRTRFKPGTFSYPWIKLSNKLPIPHEQARQLSESMAPDVAVEE